MGRARILEHDIKVLHPAKGFIYARLALVGLRFIIIMIQVSKLAKPCIC